MQRDATDWALAPAPRPPPAPPTTSTAAAKARSRSAGRAAPAADRAATSAARSCRPSCRSHPQPYRPPDSSCQRVAGERVECAAAGLGVGRRISRRNLDGVAERRRLVGTEFLAANLGAEL